jgi:hypothetical protein
MNHTIDNCDILIPQDIFEFSLEVTEGFRYLNMIIWKRPKSLSHIVQEDISNRLIFLKSCFSSGSRPAWKWIGSGQDPPGSDRIRLELAWNCSGTALETTLEQLWNCAL